MLKKKIWASFQRIIVLFTQKIITKLSKIWVWDPGSGFGDPGSGKKTIPDPGSRGQKGNGFRIRIRNTACNGPDHPLSQRITKNLLKIFPENPKNLFLLSLLAPEF